MKKNLTIAAVVVVLVVFVFILYKMQPQRLTQERLEKAAATQAELDSIEEMEETAEQKLDEQEGNQEADASTSQQAGEQDKQEDSDVFRVEFQCSNGPFVVECHEDWAPLGVERFRKLVESGFYDGARFFRVVTEPRPFVVQFGIAADPEVDKKWRDKRIKDDPVKHSNTAGTVSFASSGPNSRTTQVFINLADNKQLDNMGFSPIGEVVEGMDVVRSFENKYQGEPSQHQGEIHAEGNEFLKERYPDLDYIKKAKILEDGEEQ